MGLVFGLVFLCAGIAFKVSAAPFHMWTPDVYEGSPTPVTAFFAGAPKAAAAVMFARLLFDAFGGAVADWQQILSFLSLASMFLGALAAIGQRNFKRLMAYSSISHMGYALMGLAAGTQQGAQSLLIYLAIYVTMNVGVFVFILNMERDGKPVVDIASLGLYSRVEPARAAALGVLLFSLAGVPPLVGFFGKFYVLLAAVDAGLVWLAVGGVVASVIGAFYYIRIVYIMYFGEAVEPLDGRMPAVHWGLLAVSSLAMVVGIFNLFGVETLAAAAAATPPCPEGWNAGRPESAARSPRRSTAPMPRPCAAPRRARPGRCGSSRAGRRRPAGAAGGLGRRPRGTSGRASCCGRRGIWRCARSWRRSGSMTRWWR